MSASTLENNDIGFKMEGSERNEVLSKIEDLCKIWMPDDEHYVFMSTNVTKKTFNYFGSTFAANYVSENDNFVKSFIQHCYSSVLKPHDRIPPVIEEETDPNLVKEIDNIIEKLNVKNEIPAEKAHVQIRKNLVEMEPVEMEPVETEQMETVPVETEPVETVIGNNVVVETVKAEICHFTGESDSDETVDNAGSDYVNDSSGTDDYEVETEVKKIITPKGKQGKEKHKFKCTKCTAAYRTEALFQNHLKEHDIFDGQKSNDNSCPECSKVFSNRRSLKRHYRAHSKVKLYECKLCDKTFARSDIYKCHLNQHQEPKWECPQCQKFYHTKQSLTRHVNKCNEETQLRCKTCKLIFSEKENFDMHVCHSEEPNNLTKTYQSGKTEDGKHICGICQKVFNRRKGLLHHRKLHSDQYRNNVCNICNKNFNTREILKRHKKFVHSPSKDYVCDLCGKGFTRADSLKNHLLTHNPEGREKLACPVCGNFLSSQRSLDIHMRIHEDIVPFVCETCGKSFRQQSNLQSHMINVHTNEANFQCEKCPKKLKSRALWKVHMRFHACKEGLDVSHTSSLGKFYTCNQCTKTFATATQLKTHSRTHSNERPYTCYICLKSFKERSKLNRHSRSVHSEVITDQTLIHHSIS